MGKLKGVRTWRDDPIYEYILRSRIQPFVNWAKTWWATYTEDEFYNAGTYPGKDAPKGLFIRFARSCAHSPIKGVQTFPYVAVATLQLHHIPGGVRKFVHDICREGYEIDGLKLIARQNLHGIEANNMFIVLVPVTMINELEGEVRGRYVWLNGKDLITLAAGVCNTTLQRRFERMCREKNYDKVYGDIGAKKVTGEALE